MRTRETSCGHAAKVRGVEHQRDRQIAVVVRGGQRSAQSTKRALVHDHVSRHDAAEWNRLKAQPSGLGQLQQRCQQQQHHHHAQRHVSGWILLAWAIAQEARSLLLQVCVCVCEREREVERGMEFLGDRFVRADGSSEARDALRGKVIGLYFSAHW